MTTLPKPRKADRVLRKRRTCFTGLAHPKPEFVPDAKHREFVRQAGCQARKHSPDKHPRCSPTVGTDYTRRVPIFFSHVPTKGRGKAMGRKASDLAGGIGLCGSLAEEQERIGWPRFEAKYGIDPVAIAAELARAYAARTEWKGGEAMR